MSKKAKQRLYVLVTMVALLFVLTEFIPKKTYRNINSGRTAIVAFGDSLVFGYGTTHGKDFVSLLSQRIGSQVINLGQNGDTTAEGLKRIQFANYHNPRIVILLLGGNDYLKKVPIDETFHNLEQLIISFQNNGSAVMLLGVRGGLLVDNYESRYRELAKRLRTGYVQNVLEGLLGKKEYMYDAVHPNDKGHAIIAERVYKEYLRMITN